MAGAAGLAIAAVVAFFAGTKDTPKVNPDENACDCPDDALMVARRHAANAAIDSLNKRIDDQRATDPKAMFGLTLYNKGQAINQARVSNATDGDSHTGKADTNPLNCKPDVSKGASPCMKASLQAHENVHQDACNKANTPGRDYRNTMTMIEYWEEDRKGYEEELKYLDTHSARVTKKFADGLCKPVVGNYLGAESREEQLARRAGSKRRATQYVAGLPS
jgi:hypothetical protein